MSTGQTRWSKSSMIANPSEGINYAIATILEFTKIGPPYLDWPEDLRDLTVDYYAVCKGGLEVDAQSTRSKDRKSEQPILSAQRYLTFSKDVTNLDIQEPENAAILNATVSTFARKAVRSFQELVKRLHLNCPVVISQTGGTILSGEIVANGIFYSGPTNSMRGAASLVPDQQLSEGAAVMVIDTGGTATDVGVLQANGLPRQEAAYNKFAGSASTFSYSDVKSIGLGEGSMVRKDCAVLANSTSSQPSSAPIGDATLVQGALDDQKVAQFTAIVKQKLEMVIDTYYGDLVRRHSRPPHWRRRRDCAFLDRPTAIPGEVGNKAKEKGIAAGAVPSSVRIVDLGTIPLARREWEHRHNVARVFGQSGRAGDACGLAGMGSQVAVADPPVTGAETKRIPKISFKNKKIAAIRAISATSGPREAGKSQQEDILALVPDLIVAINA
ncbi:hypothetical protein CORC01_03942 [Colletotrichum orchidophilum]|uniref:Hydantoinase A/oxoprolinase domain-containing protein n=1 Tax=Colletotrichum orchidophilum TaxID=1209926 RepID=A0A1G4BGY3_9PEZI|nr:uncharacterized protein CORC01_03942 [Colletotrichum orchidophilum]OHF00625.1 hypothetical protein CORC01_03942 [Colletotrichum orchidophilum]